MKRPTRPVTPRTQSPGARSIERAPLGGPWDAIVVGAGHNGLVAAAYLAGAGRRVLVLERRHLVGGACVTEEIVPGYRWSRAAYVVSLFRPQIIRELHLEDYGFRLLPRHPASFTPVPGDGRGLLLGTDAAANRAAIARFSRRDAAAFPRYEAQLERFADFMEPLLDLAPPDLSATGWRKWKERLRLAPLGLRALRLGPDLPHLLELLTAPARRILERWFESEPLRSTLATDAIIGAMVSPSTPGSGYVLLHHVMGQTDGARGVWAYVEGGMGQLSEAIAASAEDLGARIVTDAPVARIHTSGTQVRGVELEDGTAIEAPVVLSGLDPQLTFGRLLDPSVLPVEFSARVAGLDMSSPVTKINVALDRLPQLAGNATETPGPEHRGTIHFTQSLAEIEAAYHDALAGRASKRPVIEMTLPSAVDSSLAPPGHHVASLFVQYTPYTLAEGSWDDPARKDAFCDRVFAVVEEFAPGFTASVVAREVLSPVDLERVFGLTGGNIFHGAMSLDQLFWLRPVPGWSRYRTPVGGLYLCGSGAHPGGGVLGAPGRNAAEMVLQSHPV